MLRAPYCALHAAHAMLRVENVLDPAAVATPRCVAVAVSVAAGAAAAHTGQPATQAATTGSAAMQAAAAGGQAERGAGTAIATS